MELFVNGPEIRHLPTLKGSIQFGQPNLYSNSHLEGFEFCNKCNFIVKIQILQELFFYQAFTRERERVFCRVRGKGKHFKNVLMWVGKKICVQKFCHRNNVTKTIRLACFFLPLRKKKTTSYKLHE